jgi:hypothetical protein
MLTVMLCLGIIMAIDAPTAEQRGMKPPARNISATHTLFANPMKSLLIP